LASTSWMLTRELDKDRTHSADGQVEQESVTLVRKTFKRTNRAAVTDAAPQAPVGKTGKRLAGGLLRTSEPKRSRHVEEDSGRSLKEKICDLSVIRDDGTWVECGTCQKLRLLDDVKDPSEVAEMWICEMNPDPEHNTCDAPQEVIQGKLGGGFLSMDYTVGSLVWAKLSPVYPWWPAIIDDDPDTMDFYWADKDGQRVSRYHVAFFHRPGSCVTRAWISPEDLMPYKKGKIVETNLAPGDSRLLAVTKAEAALNMDLVKRRQEFTFAGKLRSSFDSSQPDAGADDSFCLLSYVLDAETTLGSVELTKMADPDQEPECKRARTTPNRPEIGKDIGDIQASPEDSLDSTSPAQNDEMTREE